MKKRREGTVTVCGVATLFPSGFNSGHLVLVSAFVFSLLQISHVLGFLWKRYLCARRSSEGPDDILAFPGKRPWPEREALPGLPGHTPWGALLQLGHRGGCCVHHRELVTENCRLTASALPPVLANRSHTVRGCSTASWCQGSHVADAFLLSHPNISCCDGSGCNGPRSGAPRTDPARLGLIVSLLLTVRLWGLLLWT